ncbi:MAG: FAD-binding domain-containing protein [Pseudomonadota bacterium]
MSSQLQTNWPATRAEGLRRLDAFAPKMGAVYKAQRNYDLGPENRAGVSVLSPYLRRRLITEEEAVAAALSRHSFAAAEKFVQEVFWRTYWKGWLEMRPQVWRDYRVGVKRDRARADRYGDLGAALVAAEQGETGIDCFDAWARELAETGYLHNHARMWFASIWIFTLDLPWRLGADFFLRRLLDGDAASNTLSWRWVAGLHTKGKNYAARASNIKKYTEGRFDPGFALTPNPSPLVEDGPAPSPAPLRSPEPLDPAQPSVLLLTEEDCSAETIDAFPTLDWRAIGVLPLANERSQAAVSAKIADFDRGALTDAAHRWSAEPIWIEPTPEALVAWVEGSGARQIVTPFTPVGWVRDWLDRARSDLAEAGVVLAEKQRRWDRASWPHATAGYFKFKTKIPSLMGKLL